jgi:hypothetical protein
MTQPETERQKAWPQAMATVLSCTYTAGAGRALAFGLPTEKHFVIVYNYFADGDFHTGELRSATPIPQGSLFPITYNPAAAHEHGHEQTAVASRVPMIAFGIAGSIILSLAWFALLHGCGMH